MKIRTFSLTGLTNPPSAPASYYRAEGMIKNVNTVEEYRNMDRAKMLHQAGQMVSKPEIGRCKRH
jgi:hypothetical protein